MNITFIVPMLNLTGGVKSCRYLCQSFGKKGAHGFGYKPCR
jgi:hypothetical protein